MEELNPHLTKLVQYMETDERILACWQEKRDTPAEYVSLGIAIHDTDYAVFYAQREKWLHKRLPIAFLGEPEPRPFPPKTWLFLTNGHVWLIQYIPWASLPEHKPFRAVVLFDRTGRLEDRWSILEDRPRVEFAELDRWTRAFWLHVWAILHAPEEAHAYRLHQATQAYQALVQFSAQGEGVHLDELGWDHRLTPLDRVKYDADIKHWVADMVKWMRETGHQLATRTGWQYPETLARTVLAGTELEKELASS